ncbi:MAG: class I SAM-dependent methyltransferase [Bacteroidota bacterium]
MNPIYDQIGINYSGNRCTDPKIAEQLFSKLKGAKRIVNIGAGTGSYEPESVEVVAVEPSSEMIAQRKMDSYPSVQAYAEKLPFEDHSFSHAMTVLSMHHWENRAQAFREINRVITEKFIALTWNPASDPFWLTRDYFPEIYEMDLNIFPKMEEFTKHFNEVEVSSLMVPDDCKDGFLSTFWKRPQAYLDEQVRQSMSAFAKIGDYSDRLEKLKIDLQSGTWKERNQNILDKTALDMGYVIVSAKVKKI